MVPVYGNEATLPELVARLGSLAERLPGRLEAVFVVDGSPDGSLGLLERMLPESPLASQVVAHSRNFGSFPAIRTGLGVARGDLIGVMAADLQEPPELMEDFYATLSGGEFDVCVGRREGREDPRTSLLLSRVFWGLYRRLINKDIPRGGVDVFACTREVSARILEMREAHTSLVGLLFWVGYRRAETPYRRAPRPEGKSGWTLRKRSRYLLDSVFSFTDLPIHVLALVGLIGTVVTTGVSVVVFVAWLAGMIEQPGYTPLMLVILFSTFLLTSGLAVVGSYVWRTYENSKGRPWAIAMRHRRFNDF